jgi:ABC-type antimicrobial peptide transport system permease subunit
MALIATAVVAALIPAIKAMRIDPAVALRAE